MRNNVFLLALIFSAALSGAENPQVRATPLLPDEAAKTFTVPADLKFEQVLAEPQIAQPVFLNFDERGRMWVVEYRQYPQPEGLKPLSHDSVWRAVYDKVPEPPPRGARGRDRITIHEDTTGNGMFDKHTVFLDGLNIATAVERGRGGVWVLNPPYLLFYPCREDADAPEGPPEVHLQGFGLEDTHSVVNSLRWGPDGWLYGAQGSTVSGHIRRPDQPESAAIHSMGQLIWRYHPRTHRYEIFAEGGGNTFGVELDSKGRIFSGHNGGDTHGFHYVQGGYSQKGFDKHGPLSNPYAFGYFPQMAQEPKIARFTHNFLIYEGDTFPAAYRGKLFGCQPINSFIAEAELIPEGSTFRTRDIAEVVQSSDKWFRPVDIKLGPDGALYIADWYDRQITHFRNQEGQIDRSNGRVYRLQANGAKVFKPADLSRKSSTELAELLRSDNRWMRQTALRLLGDRRDTAIIPTLEKTIAENTGQFALESLWALYQSGGLSETAALRTLSHPGAFVRLWTVRLLCDENTVSPAIASVLGSLAAREQNTEARNQLACSARRLPAADSFPVIRNLLNHSEDENDRQIPLLIWWANEAKCEKDPAAVLKLFDDPDVWNLALVKKHILARLARRFAADGHRDALLSCAALLKKSPGAEQSQEILNGIEKAFEGSAAPSLPTELLEAMAAAGGDSLMLDLRTGKPDAVERALAVVSDEKAKSARRLRFVQAFGEVHAPASIPALLDVATKKGDTFLRKAALNALQQYDDPAVSKALLSRHAEFPGDLGLVAQSVLSSRPAWALEFLRAIERGEVERGSVQREIVDKLRLFDSEAIATLTEKLWGKARAAGVVVTPEMRAAVERYAKIVQAGGGAPLQGKAIFASKCAGCHTLFGEGGRVGPDLTPYKRDDLDTMLLSITSPSAEIREGYEAFLVKTKDGRRITGILVEQNDSRVALRGADGQEVSIQRAEIEKQKPLGMSLMPEGILEGLSETQVRDLFAYLRSSQPPK